MYTPVWDIPEVARRALNFAMTARVTGRTQAVVWKALGLHKSPASSEVSLVSADLSETKPSVASVATRVPWLPKKGSPNPQRHWMRNRSTSLRLRDRDSRLKSGV
jgi:hypothetical protein